MDLIPEEQRDPVFRQRERELMRLAQPLGTVRVRVRARVRDRVGVRVRARVRVRVRVRARVRVSVPPGERRDAVTARLVADHHPALRGSRGTKG